VPIAWLRAVTLLVIDVHLNCGCPISSRVLQMGTASLQPAANSTLEAEDTTCLIIADNVRMAPLLNSLSS
jgi:hypothetical protein